jgi:hypothetical protein
MNPKITAQSPNQADRDAAARSEGRKAAAVEAAYLLELIRR